MANVIAPKYRALYAAKKRGCGDELNALIRTHCWRNRKLDMERFDALLAANGVRLA